MKLRRLFGGLLILAAVAGFIFSLAGLAAVWYYRPGVQKSVNNTLTLFDTTINTTQNGLTVMGQLVLTTSADVGSLQTTILAMSQTLKDTNPMLDSLTTLTGKDLPTMVKTTHASLASAQTSALVIDNTLSALSSIPFVSIPTYNPDDSLHASLANISTSLDSLTPALATITTGLESGKANLGGVEDKLNNISVTTKDIGTELSDLYTVIGQYQISTTQLKVQMEAIQTAASGGISAFALILSCILVWSLAAQVGLYAQGLDMLRDRRKATRTHGKFKPEKRVTNVNHISIRTNPTAVKTSNRIYHQRPASDKAVR